MEGRRGEREVGREMEGRGERGRGERGRGERGKGESNPLTKAIHNDLHLHMYLYHKAFIFNTATDTMDDVFFRALVGI